MKARHSRIGVLLRRGEGTDEEYRAFIPSGVASLSTMSMDVSRAKEQPADRISVETLFDSLRSVAAQLHGWGPDVVALGDDASVLATGANGEASLARLLEEILGCPAVTMSAACCAALKDLGARRLALVSPWSAAVTSALEASLADEGLEIVGSGQVSLANGGADGPQTAEGWQKAGLEVLGACPKRPQALLLVGGGCHFANAITAFEAQVQLPVVTGPGALIRAALSHLDVPALRPGRGRLFHTAPQEWVATVAARQSTATKSFALSETPPVFVAAAGSRLVDDTGRGYLDFATGSGTVALGHGHPAIRAALDAQADTGVLHVGPHFHVPAQARLYERLAAILPAHLDRFHPATGGAEATEAAIKAAMHATGARRFLGFEGGYHGRTFGALSVSGMRGRNGDLGPFAPVTEIMPFPKDPETGRAVADRIADQRGRLAGVIVEPVQATAGLRAADPKGLAVIARAAERAGVPLILDEVFTGFGRCGRVLAQERYDLEADLVILGKSFGGGLPAGLVAGRSKILSAWPQGAQSATFQLHPAAAATSLAFIQTLVKEGLVNRAEALERLLRDAIAPLATGRGICGFRGLGAFHVIATDGAKTARRIRQRALSAGLITWECGLSGEVIGLVPPLTVSEEEIAEAAAILRHAVS